MNLYDMDNIGLKNHLLSNMQLIKRSDVRDVLMSPEKHYAFVWLVQELDDYSYISDDDMVKRILNDDRVNDKMNAILTSCKDISMFLNNENVLKFIFSKSLSSYFYSLDYNSSIPVINYMLSNNFEQYFSYFAPKIQTALLNDKEILNGILNSKYLRNIILNSTPDVFNVLIKHERTRNVVFNLKISDINVLVKQDIYFPLDVSLDSRFRNIFLDVNDVSKYRSSMNEFEKNNGFAASVIDQSRDADYDFIYNDFVDGLSFLSRQIFKEIDSGNKFNYLLNDNLRIYFLRNNVDLKDANMVKSFLYKYDNSYMKDIFIDRFFKDVPSNFLKNLNVMINYIDSLDKKIIDENRIHIYKKILNFDSLSFPEKKEFYGECRKIPDLYSLFYDDYRLCRDNTYSSLISDAIDPIKRKDLISLEKSKIFGVPVYELNGEKFFAFIHVTSFDRDSICNADVWHNEYKDGFSLSYIGSNNLTTFHNPRMSIVLGFSDLDYRRFVHLYESDSFSNYNSKTSYSSPYVQKMYTPDDFINNTMGYNEIVYQEKSRDISLDRVCPSFVVCYDTIMDGDLSVAKRYNIPILLINTKKYKFSKNGIFADDSERYDDINLFHV